MTVTSATVRPAVAVGPPRLAGSTTERGEDLHERPRSSTVHCSAVSSTDHSASRGSGCSAARSTLRTSATWSPPSTCATSSGSTGSCSRWPTGPGRRRAPRRHLRRRGPLRHGRRRGRRRVAGLEASRLEIDRGGVSYTADTLAELARRHPDAELFTIVGSDAAAGLLTWERYDEVAGRSRLVVVERPGAGRELPGEVSLDPGRGPPPRGVEHRPAGPGRRRPAARLPRPRGRPRRDPPARPVPAGRRCRPARPRVGCRDAGDRAGLDVGGRRRRRVGRGGHPDPRGRRGEDARRQHERHARLDRRRERRADGRDARRAPRRHGRRRRSSG